MSAGPADGWMNLMTEAYITGVGAYLPGDPAGNTELAARFGNGSAARHRRPLAANEIRTRHVPVSPRWCTDGWAAARWSCCRRPGAAQPRDVRR
jgi:3-oxoacyl-[acyl-carrier-protein] synthase-3